ncbi:helix-turn-helix domain-containing protein [Arthrobacter sp. GCM10027362]|uniref:helix-turn-helix domain-containing protein n=1 Tax=Arthrobacter sp. GCM10027362 TaxID=3273379 RepID=UPI00362773B8
MSDDEDTKYEGPWQVAAGTQGNHRFGALLKDMRKRSGLSPQQLADQADVHVSFVRGIERGAQAPSVATARPLLACMKEQERIQWMDTGPYDLLIRDLQSEREVAFEFKAKVKGQNRRTEVDPLMALAKALAEAGQNLRTDIDPALRAGVALITLVGQKVRTDVDPAIGVGAILKLAEGMQQTLPPVAMTGEPRADVVRHAGDEQLWSSAPADDDRFGRVVRLLAAADEELLGRVESLLRDDLGPRQPGT